MHQFCMHIRIQFFGQTLIDDIGIKAHVEICNAFWDCWVTERTMAYIHNMENDCLC